MPNYQALQVFYGVLPVVGAILLANWNNNKRIEDIKTGIYARFDDLNKRLDDFRSSLDRLSDRVTDLEKGIRLVRS
jgi:hypothetical protein